MRKSMMLSFIILLAQFVAAQDYPIQPVPFHKVKLEDKFWLPRIESVRNATIPAVFSKNVETQRVKNFEIAAGLESGGICTVYPFDDTDVYKAIEGAANALRIWPNTRLEKQIDSLVELIGAAQEPDGYLYTWRRIRDRQKASGDTSNPARRIRNLSWLDGPRWANEDKLSHELYNSGHLYEAAVAYYEATGKRKLLDIALKNAELVYKDFGPGKLEKAPGHQEVEVGLVKLYHTTGDKRWLDLAKFFIDVRGYGEEYSQNHQKLKDQRVAVGHAVRLGYLYMGVADVAALTGTKEYDEAMKAVWEDIVGSQMYLTGGVGATGSNEGFGGSFDLPNYSAYNETCSSISFALWSQRMFQLTGDSHYLDVAELTIYNALNAGMSLSGDHYFYPNPLESRKNTSRTPWFTCACCPPNLTRFFTALPGLFYAASANSIYLNHYAASRVTMEVPDAKGKKTTVMLRQETNYPWEGDIRIHIESARAAQFALKLRIPGWARGKLVPLDLYRLMNAPQSPVVLKVNGKGVPIAEENGFAVIDRKWKKGDVVELNLPMEVQKILANPKVTADEGRFALKRGPMVYCIEGKDQTDDRVLNVLVRETEKVSVSFDKDLFGGIQTLNFNAALVEASSPKGGLALLPMQLKAIPYFMWANRGADNMLVWLPYQKSVAIPVAQFTLASKAKASASEGCRGNLSGVSDQIPVQNSADHESTFVHWWPKFGTTEWLQYDLQQEEQVGTVRVYFFDDEATNGGCRVPKSWTVKYLENGSWHNVYPPKGFSIVKDGWTEIQFEPVKTKSLRLEMTFKEGVSGGIHEWEVR